MITEEVWEKAWEVIARVRDAYPRVINDAPSEEIVEALADAGLLARTEAWEDDARAEAERLWPHGEYHDPLMRGAMREKQRAFIAGAEWAAAHAKTTTAEDVTRVRAQIALLLTQHAQSVLAREGVFDFDETSERIDAILGLLATARTQEDNDK